MKIGYGGERVEIDLFKLKQERGQTGSNKSWDHWPLSCSYIFQSHTQVFPEFPNSNRPSQVLGSIWPKTTSNYYRGQCNIFSWNYQWRGVWSTYLPVNTKKWTDRKVNHLYVLCYLLAERSGSSLTPHCPYRVYCSLYHYQIRLHDSSSLLLLIFFFFTY